MTTTELVGVLRAAGVLVTVNADRVHVNAPPGVLTDDLRAALVDHKTELLGLLTVESVVPACPTCLKPGQRLGTFTLDDGRGRYECLHCNRVWWALRLTGTAELALSE